ncbi:hypothetical protein RclHR1_24340002 [Rhizophagus clarus]|uniref:Endonuclease/exonuclease/phosphatase domain-containing protein n=1 Tax=Rhizophagus clarus TaxID=94130 RepID=A0A2Z6QXU8_9GLOM|nr:hypothetical protein RclHR1_24340002 [Rhizophagus clarus]
MHLILCSKRRSVMHRILQSYQNHLFSKLREAGELADVDPTPMLRKLSSLSCWTISSSNWSSYALIWGCLPTMFIDLFVNLSIPRQSAITVVAAIHNNFIQKLRKCIWNPHTYDKSKWEDAMNITFKLKTTPRPSNSPATSYMPFSSLPPPTHLMTPRDSEVDWIKNSMTQGWDVNFYSGRDYIALFLVSFIIFCFFLSIVNCISLIIINKDKGYYATFALNFGIPPNPIDIENLSLHNFLFSPNHSSPPPFNSFNISSLNINGLKTHSHNKIELLNNFFSLRHISFGSVVDTHLHPKQMHFLSKRLSSYKVFSSPLDTSQHVRSSGGVSLQCQATYLCSLHTPTSDQILRDATIDLLLQALSDTKRLSFHHAICSDFNMHLDHFYPIFFNQPQIASKRIDRLFNFLLSNGYVNFTPVNFSDSLDTFHHANIITRIDYVWSCPLLKSFLLTSLISDACDSFLSDHNPVITYFDSSFLLSSIKLVRA